MKDKKIVDYTVSYSEYLPRLIEIVKKRLRNGWQPYGNPFIHANEDHYLQAMVKYEDVESCQK
jgi:hypothetical protein